MEEERHFVPALLHDVVRAAALALATSITFPPLTLLIRTRLSWTLAFTKHLDPRHCDQDLIK